MRFALRLALVMLLSLGLVLPRVSVALAVLGGAEGAVFCDGHGLTTLALEAPDEPGRILEHAPCALLHALADGGALPLPGWQPAPLALAAAPAASALLSALRPARPQARAPPVAA